MLTSFVGCTGDGRVQPPTSWGRREWPSWLPRRRTVGIMQEDAYMPMSDHMWNDLIDMAPGGSGRSRGPVGDPMGSYAIVEQNIQSGYLHPTAAE